MDDSNHATSTNAVALPEPANESPSQVPSGLTGLDFWLIVVSLMVSMFLSALDITSISTALPTIVQHLHGDDFVWVGNAAALGSTAVLPLTGGLAQIFGRRPVVLGTLILFALGAAISGAAVNMSMMIAAIQGIGGGGILTLTDIVIADLVPLDRRGLFMGISGAVWALASAIGPPIGGAFAERSWRWLFYLNIPLTIIAIVMVYFFLHLKIPKDNLPTKFKRMDWIGNVLIIVSITITSVALTGAGVKYPWSSFQVLVPLTIGITLLPVFFFYEAKYAVEPVVPWRLLNNRTPALGYFTTFLHGVVTSCVVFYLPVYFQASKEQRPVQSGVSLFGNAFTLSIGSIIAGVAVSMLGFYKPQNLVGWALAAIGIGLLSILKADSGKAEWVGFQIIEGFGLGSLYAGPTFPILSSLPVSESAHALALVAFLQSYSEVWGVTLGATILQNGLKQNLPTGFNDMFSSNTRGVELAYAVIPGIPSLAEPLRTQVKAAFAKSLRTMWLVMLALCVLGTLCALGMKEIKMHQTTDDEWGMREREKDEPPVTEKGSIVLPESNEV